MGTILYVIAILFVIGVIYTLVRILFDDWMPTWL